MEAVALLLAAGGAWAALRGPRLLIRGWRGADDPSSSLTVVRGIRGIAIAVGAWALAAGMVFGQTWLLVFGSVFLAEELYETGVVALILRRQALTAVVPHPDNGPPSRAREPRGPGGAR